jgi:uncharacterized protein (TIGR02466 family)
MILQALFPIPLGKESFSRSLTKEELLSLKELEMGPNKGNKSSKNSYILDLPPLKSVKEELHKHLNDYFKSVMCPPDNVDIYITQSWLNTTNSNEYHHAHNHVNSYISGVFYVQAEGDSDRITFDSPHQLFTLHVENKEFNPFNSDSWWMPVSTGEVLLFPSTLTHSVTTPTSKNTRVSIAFNTFLKGNLGIEDRKTQLFLGGGK